MSVYRLQSDKNTFFVFDNNENGRLDAREAVFLDNDGNERLSASDIYVSHAFLNDELANYGVRRVQRLNLPNLETYTASLRKLHQNENSQAVDFYWEHLADLLISGQAAGLSQKDLARTLPSSYAIQQDYRAAFAATLTKICAVVAKGNGGKGPQSAVSALTHMMQEAEASRTAAQIPDVVFYMSDLQMLYRRTSEAYVQGAEFVRPQVMGLDVSLSYQDVDSLGEVPAMLRKSAYDDKSLKIVNYLLLRSLADTFSRLAADPAFASSDQANAVIAPLVQVILKEFIADEEFEAAALALRICTASPQLVSVDWSADCTLVQKAIADAVITAFKNGDQKTAQALLTLLREPLKDVLPQQQAQLTFDRIAFEQSVIAADQAGLAKIADMPSVLLSPEEASELIAAVHQPGIKAQLQAAFPLPKLQPQQPNENALPRKARGVTVEP
jgi:hypothetical protein